MLSLFFFSSRRRHTRFDCDWSSDVCSSDLDIQSIFQVVIRTLEEHLPVDFCCICLYDPAENCLIVTSVGLHSQALSMELAMTAQARIEIDQNGFLPCVYGRLVFGTANTHIPFPLCPAPPGWVLP